MSSTPATSYNAPATPVPATPTPAGRSGTPSALSFTNAKRGRKPRPGGSFSATNSPQVSAQDFKMPIAAPSWGSTSATGAGQTSSNNSAASSPTFPPAASSASNLSTFLQNNPNPTTAQLQSRIQQLSLPSSDFASTATRPLGLPTPTGLAPVAAPAEEEGDDDELLPAMADDDYSAQLSWQSQSKDNLKVLMDNFTEAQYDRFEAYRRHALPKQGVRKVIQQTLGQQVSQPVAQIVAGFSKVFVGEMVEKARAVQARRGESGPLTPDHLREAYRLYQEETGRVGTARPLRGKKLFVR